MPLAESHVVETDSLRIAYEVRGDGKPIVLLHGWPDSVRTWDSVAPELAAAGYRTIAPSLRGYGGTSYRDGVRRSGQIVAFAQDVIDLLNALNLDRVVFLGHDWGARTGYALAALWPERFERIVLLASGYETGIKPGDQIKPEQAAAYWYQWFWHTDRGREALERNRRDVCRFLWKTWSPHMKFTDAEFDATASAWDNPDWVETTLHSYRVRWGAAEKDPRYADLDARMGSHPTIRVPTTVLHGDADGATLVQSSAGQEASFSGGYRRRVLSGVGHFVQREKPSAVVDAVLHGG